MAEVSKVADYANENLWRQYLSLPADQREQEFLSTALAAKRVGVSSRTIHRAIAL